MVFRTPGVGGTVSQPWACCRAWQRSSWWNPPEFFIAAEIQDLCRQLEGVWSEHNFAENGLVDAHRLHARVEAHHAALDRAQPVQPPLSHLRVGYFLISESVPDSRAGRGIHKPGNVAQPAAAACEEQSHCAAAATRNGLLKPTLLMMASSAGWAARSRSDVRCSMYAVTCRAGGVRTFSNHLVDVRCTG